MDSLVEGIFQKLMAGGPGAVIASLLLVIVVLIWQIKQLQTTITKKDEKLEKIIDDYYKGNMTVADALNSLKSLLYEIRGRLPG